MNPKYSLILFFVGSFLIVGGAKLYENKKSYKILRSENINIVDSNVTNSNIVDSSIVDPDVEALIESMIGSTNNVSSESFKALPPTLDGPEEETGDHPPISIVKNPTTVVKKYSSTLHRIKPSDVPDTYPHWNYYGSGTLKNHLYSTHGVAYELMALFMSEKDLKKLHSYLHNGYDLLNL